jgi:glycosyltransferase involved in cell wall biosynthesis
MGEEKENLIKMAETLLIKDNILFLGKVSDEEKIKRILMADVYVLPSKVEGATFSITRSYGFR